MSGVQVSDQQLSPTVSRALWAAAEPFALFGLAAPEAHEAMANLGMPRQSNFLALRGAPLGKAEPAVLAAAFHGFPRSRFEIHLTPIWQTIEPSDVVDGTHAVIPVMMNRVFGDSVDRAELARQAALLTDLAQTLDTAGRPLAAANQAVTSPDDPWAKLWRAWTTLREFRGDTHVAELVAHDVTVIEAQVLGALWKGDALDVEMLRNTRKLDDEVWQRGVASLQARGLIDSDGALTEAGAALREEIELRTDIGCLRAWSQLSTADLEAVYSFTLGLSEVLVAGDHMRARTAVGAPWPAPGLG
ncbi:MAG: hypothetical protein Q7L55_02580 [Actinomycetota bacterium]|nr:hypothetical protein [Actinomycetota bacterium]